MTQCVNPAGGAPSDDMIWASLDQTLCNKKGGKWFGQSPTPASTFRHSFVTLVSLTTLLTVLFVPLQATPSASTRRCALRSSSRVPTTWVTAALESPSGSTGKQSHQSLLIIWVLP